MDGPPNNRSRLQSKKISKPGSELSKSAKIGPLVMKAIKALKEPDGCSLGQIKNYMSSKLNINTDAATPQIKNYLKKAMADGILSQEKGKFKVQRRRRRKSKSKRKKKSGKRRRRRSRKGGKKKAKKGGKNKGRSRRKKGGKKKGKAKKGKSRRTRNRGHR